MHNHPVKSMEIKQGRHADLLEKGQELLKPTISIAREIRTLRLDSKYAMFEADLDKVLSATDRLSDLIRLLLSRDSSIEDGVDIQTVNANAIHDLCTPIIAITGYSEMVLEDLDIETDPQGCETLRHVLLLSQKLLNLIKALNYFTEIAQPTSYQPAPTSQLKPHTHHSLMTEVISGMRETVENEKEASLLVIDDKESNRDFLSRRLRKQGFTVDIAENGRKGLEMVHAHPYDLILLDIIMPELDGYQMLAKLKEDATFRHIPVIMISALNEIDSVVKCIEMGAEDYLQKPFNQIILTAKISAALDRKWLRSREQAYIRKLKHEQEMTEKLLLNILPESVAERLKNGESSIADSFDEVTVLFADIVKFSEMSVGMSPEKLVERLNDIFLAFDILTESHGLEKIKTIGDAYMLVGGMPSPRPDHVKAVANIALDMQQSIHQMNVENGTELSIRIGIHTGSVVAGVIGKHKFSYDLWGDAVNVASRMDSHGLPDHIQISETVYQRIKDDFMIDTRDPINVKGQGIMQTYFLRGTKA